MFTILVTGGAGFIGSEFVRQGVNKNYKIVVLDKLTYAGDLERLREVKNSIVFYQGDITDKPLVERIFAEEKPEVVCHFAAETHVDRSILDASPFIDTNVKGTMVLLNAARKYGIEKFINMSTDEVYGELGRDGEFFENSPMTPNSPYSASKAAADMLGRAYFRTYGVPVITVRASNNYGPWQYPEKLIPVIILKSYNNEKVPIYGKGKNVREWLHVSDCVEAIFKIINRGKPGEVYNVGSGFEKRNIDVARTVLKLMEKPESLITFVKDRPGHDFRYSLNFDKIKRELGWEPKISFEEGIKKTVAWYLENIQWVKAKRRELEALWKKVYE